MPEVTADPDVIAYDEAGDVIFTWQGCPDATDVNALPDGGLGAMAIKMAHLIRRRDGYVLKSRDGVTGFPEPEEAPVEIPIPEIIADKVADLEPSDVHKLERVELIPPPEELTDHTPLGNEGLMRIALWVLLMKDEDEQIFITDRDVVKALSKGSLSIEHHDDGNITVRAHNGPLDIMPIKPEEQQ